MEKKSVMKKITGSREALLAIVLIVLFVIITTHLETETDTVFDKERTATQCPTLGLLPTSALVTSNNDVYLSNVGYLFSPMRFRVRGYDSQYSDMYINGVQLSWRLAFF